jgi:hypothetical protein
MQEKKHSFRVVVGTPTRGPRYRLEDNIKMDLEEIGWEGVDWIGLPQDKDQRLALVNTAINVCFP